jgi:D-alanyl-lipoteichoic acid acyltransferase DltB (MBOAT superfamily)
MSPGKTPTLFLIIASLAFYGWWKIEYVALLLASILLNYGFSLILLKTKRLTFRKIVLALGIIANLTALFYFKYADFFIETINLILNSNSPALTIILPLAISFYSFQQIAYLVDSYQGKTHAHGFLDYCLFVCFFPQLIAGPIVHYSEMLPQFRDQRRTPFNASNIAIGIALFTLGLAKKVLIADNMAPHSSVIFAKADAGQIITFLEAWQAALAYSLQLYFDFSGYCDMAMGIARLFGIILPINFNSPYKAKNIIDFWRRWHITLSRFLKDYLYIPLGGNRKGPSRRYINLLITMLLGGIWHGAGWNFIIWGSLHGIYLIINHGWRGLHRKLPSSPFWLSWTGNKLGVAITLIAIIIGWVFFRAETYSGAINMLRGMAGNNGIVIPAKYFDRWGELSGLLINKGIEFRFVEGFSSISPLYSIFLLWCVVRYAPNTLSLLRSYKPTLSDIDKSSLEISLTKRSAVVIGLLFIISIASLNKVSEFLYFQF